MEERLHVFFSGRVQGVGFRFTARQLAARFEIKGWVKNLSDGRVELLVQGKSAQIRSFLEDLKERFAGYAVCCDIEEMPPGVDLEDFAIRFY